jgi:ATP-dependent DNA helicase Q1
LELSREVCQSNSAPGPSKSVDEPSYLRKQALNAQLSGIESEIREIDQEIKDRKEIRSDLLRQKADIEKQIKEVQPTRNGTTGALDKKGKGKARQDGIDYMLEFDWSYELKARMKKVFGIDNFRLCQQGCVRLLMERVRCFDASIHLQCL